MTPSKYAAIGTALLAACAPEGADTDDTASAVPEIADVLDCGTVGVAGGIGGGTDLQRQDLDETEFPDALCNDGTVGFFYFRPYEGVVNRDRWVIQLQGGGACANPTSCLARWCSVDTNFGMQGMTGTESPESGIRGDGILARRGDNPTGGFNQVFVRYCSSDAWAGTRRDAVVTGAHPVTGEDVTVRMHFGGARIVDAVLATLRQDGQDAPTYTLDGGSTALPDLDDAAIVVLAGGSAGGAGTIRNGDRVGEVLRAHNTACQGASCPLDYSLLVDSITGPSIEHYDYSATRLCTEFGVCSYEDHMSETREIGGFALYESIDEPSCASVHATDGALWKCADNGHVVRHHVTTPMIVRMGQTDSNLSADAVEAGYRVDGEPLDLATYARLVREDLAALAIPGNSEEGDSMSVAPAVFAPTCADHETLGNNASVYGVTIDVEGSPTDLFGLAATWRTGEPAVAIASGPADNSCADD